MDVIVTERRAGPLRLLGVLGRVLRRDRAAAGVFAAGLAARLAVVLASLAAPKVAPTNTEIGGGIAALVLITAWFAVGTFFQVALLAVLDGRRSARQGLAVAARRLRAIAASVVDQRRGDGFSWWLPSFVFTLPVIASEDVGHAEAKQRSRDLADARWGRVEIEATAARTFVVNTLIALAVLAFCALCVGEPVSSVTLVGCAVAAIAVFTVARAMRAVLAFAVFRHQVDGVAPFGLTPAELDELVGPAQPLVDRRR